MKRGLLAILAIALLTPAALWAGDKNKQKKKEAAAATAAPADKKEEGIHWMTLEEAQVAMKKEPRKVYMDVYTDWCGWCKVMEKKTFTNQYVINYINEKFYAVRLNAEQKEEIRFMGKMYGPSPDGRTNQLANDLMHGQMSYPTSILMQENFQTPQPVPGYLDVPTMEMVLKYFGDDLYKTTPWESYQQNFKASWS